LAVAYTARSVENKFICRTRHPHLHLLSVDCAYGLIASSHKQRVGGLLFRERFPASDARFYTHLSVSFLRNRFPTFILHRKLSCALIVSFTQHDCNWDDYY